MQKLETKDTDPRVVIEKKLMEYFSDKDSLITRVDYRNLICEYYHDLSYFSLK